MQTTPIDDFIRSVRHECSVKWKDKVILGQVPPIRGMARLTREAQDLAFAECKRRNMPPAESQRAIATQIIDRTIGDVDARGIREEGFQDLAERLGIILPGERATGGEQYRRLQKRMEEIELDLLRQQGIDLRMYDIYGVGNPVARQQLCDYMRDAYGLTYPIEQIFMSTGAISAMDRTIQMLRKHFSNLGLKCDFGFPAPGWAVAKWQAETTGLPVCLIQTREDADYKLSPEQLRQTLADNPDLRVLYVTITNNPTAYSYSPRELTGLFQLVSTARPELIILADCAYVGTADAETDKARMQAIKDGNVFEQTIVVSSMSKIMTLTGDRFGWVSFGTRAIADLMSMGWNNSLAGLPREWQLSFMAHMELYRSQPELGQKIRQLYALRRQRLIAELNELNRVYNIFDEIGRDEGGGIYNRSKFKPGQDVFTLFEKTGIAGVPGSAFGYNDKFVRFSVGIVPTSP